MMPALSNLGVVMADDDPKPAAGSIVGIPPGLARLITEGRALPRPVECPLKYEAQEERLLALANKRLSANDLYVGQLVRFRPGCCKLGRIMADDQPMIVVAKMAPIFIQTSNNLYDELHGAALDIRVGVLDADADMHEFSVSAGWLEIINR